MWLSKLLMCLELVNVFSALTSNVLQGSQYNSYGCLLVTVYCYPQ